MTWFFEIIVHVFMSKMKHALDLEENTPGAFSLMASTVKFSHGLMKVNLLNCSNKIIQL